MFLEGKRWENNVSMVGVVGDGRDWDDDDQTRGRCCKSLTILPYYVTHWRTLIEKGDLYYGTSS